MDKVNHSRSRRYPILYRSLSVFSFQNIREGPPQNGAGACKVLRYLLPELLDGVRQFLAGDVLLVDRAEGAGIRAVVVLLPTRQRVPFVSVHAVLRVPVVTTSSPRHICAII